MTDRVLIIEDDDRLAAMVRDYLGGAGFDVTIAGTGEKGLSEQQAGDFSAIILDLMLPDLNGLDICRKLRAQSRVPILMLTAKGDPMDRVIGLEIGADDYLPKPFEPRELVARLRAILRRTVQDQAMVNGSQALRFGSLEIDGDAMVARLSGKECNLTAHQFNLLQIMAQSPGRVLSRDYLMDRLKGHELDAFDRSIDVHISRIRAEIETDPKSPKRVITVRGAGYVFARQQD